MIKRTLYFGNPTCLHFANQQLVIELVNESKKTTIPIEDIGIVILDHAQITITQTTLSRLLENNTAVITCNETHHPIGMLLPLESNTLQSERFRHQVDATIPLKKQLWQQTIVYKIENQANILQRFGMDAKPMLYWAKHVRSGDPDNLEARAAAYYWKTLFDDDFTRDRYGDYPNNLLNYGYAILRATVARSLVASGLLPTLGIHHSNKYNAYCLADDIMEPYRPLVDELVYNMYLKNKYDEVFLTKETKAKLLEIPVLDVVIDNKRSPLMIGTQITTASLAKCYMNESKKIKYPSLC